MSIGEKIRELRTEKGLTLTQLAKDVDISASMLSQIERGTKTVSMQLGVALATKLGCTLQDLAGNK